MMRVGDEMFAVNGTSSPHRVPRARYSRCFAVDGPVVLQIDPAGAAADSIPSRQTNAPTISQMLVMFRLAPDLGEVKSDVRALRTST